MSVVAVTDRHFTKDVLQSDVPVLVACGADWCVSSEELRPAIEEVAAKYEGRAKVVAVDVNGDPRANKILRGYRVTRLPVVMLFHEGELRDLVGGMASAEVITEMLERRLRPVRDVAAHNFEAEVLCSAVPVLVHFAGAWCAASQELEPLVESIAEQYRGRAKVVRVEFGGSNAALCAQYGIFRVPTLALFAGGQVRDQIFGAMKGGTWAEGVRDLSPFDNVAHMVEEFVL